MSRSSRRAVGGPDPPVGTPEPEPYSSFRISARLSLESVAYRFSHAHPELRIEVLARLDLDGEHQVAELRVLGRAAAAYADELRRTSGVSEVELHSETERDAIYRVTMVTGAGARAARSHGILVRFPMVLQDGWLRFETVAPASEIRQFLRYLEGAVGPARVEAVRQIPEPLGAIGLTASQDLVFRAALQAGYYNAPRGISVSDLALRLGRSKSTVSQQLAKIQRSLAEAALRLEFQGLPSSAP
jgi:predicted DNA binding protein